MSELDPSVIHWLNQAPHAVILVGLIFLWRKLQGVCLRITKMEIELNGQKHAYHDHLRRSA